MLPLFELIWILMSGVQLQSQLNESLAIIHQVQLIYKNSFSEKISDWICLPETIGIEHTIGCSRQHEPSQVQIRMITSG